MAGEAFGVGGDQPYDRKVMLTYPVDMRTIPEGQKAAYGELAASGAHMTYYPGSVKGRCEDCHTEVYIGPNQQQRLRDQPGIDVLCAYCAGMAVALAAAAHGEVATHELQPAGVDYNPDGIPRIFVDNAPGAKKYRISCIGCGRKMYTAEPLGRKVAICPDCMKLALEES